MTTGMKWFLLIVICFFAWMGLIALFAGMGANLAQERYMVCVENGGSYYWQKDICKMDGE